MLDIELEIKLSRDHITQFLRTHSTPGFSNRRQRKHCREKFEKFFQMYLPPDIKERM
jgi:hypothetical protein